MWEFKVFPGLFWLFVQLQPVYSPKNAWPPRFLGTCQKFSVIYGHLILQIFLSCFMISLLFFSTIIHYLGQLICSTLASDRFQQTPQDKGYSAMSKLWVRYHKASLASGVFQGIRSNNDIFLGMELWKTFSHVFPPAVASGQLIFTMNADSWLLKLP